MKYLFTFLILLISLSASKAQSDFCSQKNIVIHDGEKIDFQVYYNLSAIWVAAGSVSFSTELKKYKDKPIFHLIGKGQTFKSYEWIYKVNDTYESYVDTQSLLPLLFSRHVNQNDELKRELVLFNRDSLKAESNKQQFDISQCTQDVLSVVYYARNIDYDKYKVNDTIPFDMFIDKELHHLYIRYLGKQITKTRNGTYKTIKIKPLLVAGTVFSGGEQMEVYVTDDKNRIPVRINSPILVGSIKVDMINYTGLRFPLEAKIKD